jgi:hypothetical protein
MAHTDTYREGATPAVLVAEPEAVPTAALPLPFREPDWPALAVTALGLSAGHQAPTKIDRGLLEHLSGGLLPPSKDGYSLGDGAVRGGDEDSPGALTALPAIEGVDQVEPRPRDFDVRVCLLSGKGIGDQPKTLVVGEPGRPGVSGEHRRLCRGRSEREPERGVPHGMRERN